MVRRSEQKGQPVLEEANDGKFLRNWRRDKGM